MFLGLGDEGRLERGDRLHQLPTAGDVFAKGPAIDLERPREPGDQGIRLAAEAPAPGLLGQCETFDIRLASTSHGSPAICAAGPHNCWLKLRLCSPRISGKKSE